MTGASHDAGPELCEQLTPREIEILEWTAKGKTRAEISIILSLSEKTIKNHLENVCRKLNSVNKTQATAIALSSGLIDPFGKN